LSPAGLQQSNGSNPALSIPSEPQGYGSAFGLPLTAQQTREGEDVPVIMEKCCAAIEKYGLSSQGIYRISGISSKVQKLKEKFDRGLSKPFVLFFSRIFFFFWNSEMGLCHS
jgi:Rho GTPase-activating protein RGD1